VLTALLLVGATSVASADGTAHATAASRGVVVPIPKVGLNITLPAAWSIEHYGGPSKKVKAKMRADIARNSSARRDVTHTNLKGYQLLANDYKSQTTFANGIGISDLGPNLYPDTLDAWQQYAQHNDSFKGTTTTTTTFRFAGAAAYDATTSATLTQENPPVAVETHRIYVRSGTHNVLIVIGIGGDIRSGEAVVKGLVASLTPVR
jgi:hypothetical protein